MRYIRLALHRTVKYLYKLAGQDFRRRLARIPGVRKVVHWRVVPLTSIGRTQDGLLLGEMDGLILYADPLADGDTFFLNGGERTTAKLFKSELRRGDCVVDIGAHIGYFTLISADIVGDAGRVFAFEPHPGNFDLLLRNIRLNRLSNVVATRKAVCGQSGRAKLFLSRWGGSHSLCRLSPEDRLMNGSEKYVDVETVALDDFLAGQELKIKLIKMDIEGGEMDALRGMRRTIAENRRLVIISELNPGFFHRTYDPRIFLDALTEQGFRFSLVDERRRRVEQVSRGELLRRVGDLGYTVNLLCQRTLGHLS